MSYQKRMALREEARLAEEAEEERLLVEKRKVEREAYEGWRKDMLVAGSGQDADEVDETSQLENFILHIQRHKVVQIENLASEFRLKSQDVVQRLNELVETGRLTGIMDERGKFICLSLEELKTVSKLILEKGKISKSEDLVNICNDVVRLKPSEEDEKALRLEAEQSLQILEEFRGQEEVEAQ
eukprot:Filipodium_phascolosomae@DN8415_c0_g1_i1.p1